MRLLTIKTLIVFSLFLITASFAYLILSKSQNGTQSYFGQNIDNADLESYLSKKMEQYPIPGLSLGIINNGSLVVESYKGFADVDKQEPITQNTLFEAASLSKPVFSSFVMQHVEKGLLELDNPLFNYYPTEYVNDPRYKQITARMALSHQTGWPNWRWDRKDNKLEFQYSPAEAYLYSGEGYQYLAETLRHLHGGHWNHLEGKFQEWIAQPLQMTTSTFIESNPVPKLKAHPYDDNGAALNYKDLSDYQRNIGVYVAAASLITNVEDFSKWMIALMDGDLLAPELQSEMLTGQIGTGQHLVNEVLYTLGFFEMKVPGLLKLYGHGGNNHGFTGFFVLDPDKNWGFVILTNSEYGEQLGVELLGYLITGSNVIPYWTLFLGFLLFVLTTLFWGFRFIFRAVKKSAE